MEVYISICSCGKCDFLGNRNKNLSKLWNVLVMTGVVHSHCYIVDNTQINPLIAMPDVTGICRLCLKSWLTEGYCADHQPTNLAAVTGN